MKSDFFTDLPQRIEEDYPELDNDILLELRQKDKHRERSTNSFMRWRNGIPLS